MKIKILGTRGEIEPSAPYHSKHSGILIDNAILVDLGEEEFLKCKPQYIFITHLHPDHAYFVRSGSTFHISDTPIYAPERYKASPIIVFSKEVTCGKYTITPIPTEHSLKVKSQAYLLQKGKERILYTGDMFWIKKEYHEQLKNLDLVITDGSVIKEGGLIRQDEATDQRYGHAGIPNLIQFFKPFTKTILFIHFGSWFYNNGARTARKSLVHLGRKHKITVFVGYDGMTLDTKKIRTK